MTRSVSKLDKLKTLAVGDQLFYWAFKNGESVKGQLIVVKELHDGGDLLEPCSQILVITDEFQLCELWFYKQQSTLLNDDGFHLWGVAPNHPIRFEKVAWILTEKFEDAIG